MELWIRSQDKERLLKIQSLEHVKDDYGFYILGNEDKFSKYKLATYKSKERALEVLDEIQELLKGQLVITNISDEKEIDKHKKYWNNYIVHTTNNFADVHNLNQTIVYEMPKE